MQLYTKILCIKSLKAEDGNLNLSQVKIDDVNRIYLDGQWKFYNNKFIVTDKLENEEAIVIDHICENILKYKIKNVLSDGGGFGTYELKINNLNTSEELSSYMTNFDGAYRIFIDKELVSSSGVLSKNSKEVFSRASIDYADIFKLDGGEHIIHIEVAFKEHIGMTNVPYIANFKNDKDYMQNLYIIKIVLKSILLFCSLLYIIFYILGKAEKHLLAMPLIYLLIFIRMCLISENSTLIQKYLFNSSYESFERIIFMITLLVNIMLIISMKRLLNLEKVNIKGVAILMATITIVYFVVPYPIYYLLFKKLSIGLISILNIYILYRLYMNFENNITWTITGMINYMLSIYALNIDELYLKGKLTEVATLAVPICFIISFIIMVFLYTEKIKDTYIKDYEITKLSEQLLETNMNVMLSQIKPHFLYNTLNAIGYLCKTEPAKAENAIIKFSRYLRQNMNYIECKNNILFNDELQHIENYVNLEMLRFSHRIKVIYEIEIDDFFVPPLTIQPLVENAIKHGLANTEAKGTVLIRTYEDKENYYVVVEDNGKGFKINSIEKSESVAIKNIKYRISALLNGEIIIRSEVGEGTKVSVKLPKVYNIGGKFY